MRSVFLCVFFALLVQRGSRADDDFRPTPIPLDAWHYEREGRAGRDVTRAPPPAPPAHPARYWEDALRHSVYLTLVRDKVDQLIASGEVVSPNTKPDNIGSNEDDHDLWEKIKTAPFNRPQNEEPPPEADYTVLAMGRLMDEKSGFRFIEDERTKDKCSDDKCLQGVKALWSVKRIRQRDTEISPEGYHYELTFSVTSKLPKKQRKPYENPVRTFTVRESTPEKVIDSPYEHPRINEKWYNQPVRPARSVWYHKNIIMNTKPQSRQYNVVDRLFYSLFSKEEDGEPDPRLRYRAPTPPPTPPGYSAFPKPGPVGAPSEPPKRLYVYPHKHYTYKFARPPLQAPPVHHPHYHFIDKDVYGPIVPDQRYHQSNQIKTTRPAVLPTPVAVPAPPAKNWTNDDSIRKQNASDISSKVPDVITGFNKPIMKSRIIPMKVNYLPEHVRPPVFNAPPGVFVTMDKKPFKPMPPLKLGYSSKPIKSHKPMDFRPSPQIHDMQTYSEPDPQKDSAFRPMTWTNTNNSTKEKIEVAESGPPLNNNRKATTKGKKPPKKHENTQTERSSTAAPEIITAGSADSANEDTMEWANVVGAFAKTTPMASQKEKAEVPASSTESLPSSTTSGTSAPITPKRKRTTTTTEAPEEIEVSSQKPSKRTRPPPKFSKTSEKPKKHKRITSTTSTSSPEEKIAEDLTPQASSAPKPSTTTTTTTTTTRAPTTTTRQTTTTTQPPATTFKPTDTTSTKIKNRFRESTLIHKGTSVKHDKWSSSTSPANVEKPKHPVGSGKFPPRRKGSNFQGYNKPSTWDDKEYDDFDDGPKLITEAYTKLYPAHSDNNNNKYENNYDYSNDNEEGGGAKDDQETKDHSEFIFQASSITPQQNEINDIDETNTEHTFTAPKNKTKCKKKKTTTTEEPPVTLSTTTTIKPTTTIPPLTIFEELFGAFTDSSKPSKSDKTTSSKDEVEPEEQEEQESETHSKFTKLDDDLQDFLDSINKTDGNSDDGGEYDDEETFIEDEDSPFSKDDEDDTPRRRENFDVDRPLSLLELMAIK